MAGIDCLNVTEFGAVGDGVTDDSAAIQSAIIAALSYKGVRQTANEYGSMVYFPAGTYLVNQPLIPATKDSFGRWVDQTSGSVHLVGAGMDSVTLKAGQQFQANGLIGYGSSGQNPKLAKVHVQDMTLDGNYSGAGGTLAQPGSGAGALVSLFWPYTGASTPNGRNGQFHTFTRVRFYRPTGYVLQPTNGVMLTNCEFDKAGQPDISSGGLHYDNLGSGPGEAVVTSCNWKDSSGNYVDFIGATVGDFCRLIMTGCTSYNHQIGGIYAAGKQSVISGNSLTNSVAGSGVGYDSGTNAANRSRNVVAGNCFVNIALGASGLSNVTYGDVFTSLNSSDG